MKTIPLTQGKVAFVDDADYPALSIFKWHAHRHHSSGYWYVKRHLKMVDGKQEQITMHRFLLNPLAGELVDHIDGNGLNNQRSNLRLATTRENTINSKLSSQNRSGYRGVAWEASRNLWRVRIRDKSGRKLHIGRFLNVKDAAEAYNIAALEHHGQFARLNIL